MLSTNQIAEIFVCILLGKISLLNVVDFHHRVILRAKNRTEKIEKMHWQITSTEKVLC